LVFLPVALSFAGGDGMLCSPRSLLNYVCVS
jgi:hypothetical protein